MYNFSAKIICKTETKQYEPGLKHAFQRIPVFWLHFHVTERSNREMNCQIKSSTPTAYIDMTDSPSII